MPTQRVQAGYGGMASEPSPAYVPATQAVVLYNLLPRAGKLALRGPVSAGINLEASLPAPGENWANKRLLGAMSYGSGILVNAGLPIARWRTVVSGVVADKAATFGPGRRFCSLGSFAYSTLQQASTTKLVRWDGTVANPVELTNSPAETVDVTTHLSRLFTLGATGEPNSLR